MKWFHNYEYRHLLRSSADMQEWKKTKTNQSKWFDKKYAQLKKELKKNGLAYNGFSEEHTTIIAQVFKLDVKSLLKIYHGVFL